MPMQPIWRSIARRSAGLCAVCLAAVAPAQDCVPELDPRFAAGSCNGAVYSLASFDDGRGLAVFLGGAFTKVGGLDFARMVRWDGQQWSDVGGGVGTSPNEIPYVMTVYDPPGPAAPVLVAGGAFVKAGGKQVNGLATWDGKEWKSLGGGVVGGFGVVRALEVADIGDGERLYVGGSFTQAGGVSASNIASWDGAAFQALGAGTGGEVRAIIKHNDGMGDALFVTGNFSTAGGQNAKNIARCGKGGNWSALGAGLDLQGNCLAKFNPGDGLSLYVGGNFFNAGNSPANRIARWKDGQWSALGNGVQGPVNSITLFERPWDGEEVLVATGDFLNPASNIAAWDGSAWSGIGLGLSAAGYALAPDPLTPDRLLVGGNFTNADGVFSAAVSRTDSLNLFPVYTGADNVVRAFLDFDDGSGTKTYFGGDFKAIGGIKAPGGVARWDGQVWEPMPGLAVGGVWCFASADLNGDGKEELFAGGRFGNLADGTVAHRIARWNEVAYKWEAIGGVAGGVNPTIADMTYFGGKLVVTGQFTLTSDGVPIANLAAYDGVSWSGIGQGIPGQGSYGSSFFTWDPDADGTDELIIGGRFGTINGQSGSNLAEVSPSLQDLKPFSGGGVNGDVYAIDGRAGDRADEAELIIAGAFTTGQNGSPTLNHIALVDSNKQINAMVNGRAVGVAHPVAAMVYFSTPFLGNRTFVALDPPGNPGVIQAYDEDAEVFVDAWESDGALNAVFGTYLRFFDVGDPVLWVGGGFAVFDGRSSGGFARIACPKGEACYPDLDSSGSLDLFDFLAFVNLFNAAAPAADCDTSGLHDLFDFLCFVNAFNAGC